MASRDYDRVIQSPRFQELVRQRTKFAWTLTIVMLVIYFGFILLVAFAKPLLAIKIGGGVTSLGICLLYTSPSPRDGLLSRMPSSA